MKSFSRPSASCWGSSSAVVVGRHRPTFRTASLQWAGPADRGLRLSSRTYVSSRSLGFPRGGLEEKSVLVQEVRPRSGEALRNVTLGPVTRWWPAPTSRCAAPYRIGDVSTLPPTVNPSRDDKTHIDQDMITQRRKPTIFTHHCE